jgi:hypothetical protein
MAEATRLKICHRGYLQLHHVPPKFHESPHIGSKVISRGHREAGGLISLLLFFFGK